MPNLGRRRKPEAGLTLVELMIVVAIAAILSAVLVLSIRQIRASYAMRQAADIAVSEVRRAQSTSIAEGVNYVVEFVLGSPTSLGVLNVYRASTGQPVLVRQVIGEEWPPSVQVLSPSASALDDCQLSGVRNTSGISLCVTFGFLGSPIAPVSGGEVRLQGEAGTWKIVIEPATGRARAERL